ncbi:MAG: alpha/beta hydrolase [Gammaproteobacteria bacterium]|nr:alpha/beta hydrolase [Gammaproteobacteria bacterium]
MKKNLDSNLNNVTRGYVSTPGGQVHYRSAGPANAPVITFFHQTASSSRMFELMMSELSPSFRCLAFDTPGFGQSWQPAEVPSVAWLGNRLIEAIDALGIDCFVVCGHHTGGCIGLEIALAIPQRVLGLSIIGPVTPSFEEREKFSRVFLQPFVPESSGEYLQTAWEYLRSIGAGDTVDLHTAELIDHLIAWRSTPLAFGAVWRQDASAALAKVSIPLQLMCSRDDVLWPMYARACKLRPDAATAIVAGGDFQPDRDPINVARALTEFVNTLPVRFRTVG